MLDGRSWHRCFGRRGLRSGLRDVQLREAARPEAGRTRVVACGQPGTPEMRERAARLFPEMTLSMMLESPRSAAPQCIGPPAMPPGLPRGETGNRCNGKSLRTNAFNYRAFSRLTPTGDRAKQGQMDSTISTFTRSCAESRLRRPRPRGRIRKIRAERRQRADCRMRTSLKIRRQARVGEANLALGSAHARGRGTPAGAYKPIRRPKPAEHKLQDKGWGRWFRAVL